MPAAESVEGEAQRHGAHTAAEPGHLSYGLPAAGCQLPADQNRSNLGFTTLLKIEPNWKLKPILAQYS